jgi:hypothetical protein
MAQLIKTLVLVAFIALFSGFNINNRCDVSLIFYTFKNVPVFFTIILSFIVGVIVALPFVFVKRRATDTKKKKTGINDRTDSLPSENKKDTEQK